MKNLCSVIFTGFVLLSSLSSCQNTMEQNTPQQELDRRIAELRRMLEKDLGHDVPSISVLIDGPKGTYFTTSVGKNGVAVTENTFFRFASNTKNFTAAALLNMMQDGWLNLDDKIINPIPSSTIPYVPDTSEWQIPHKNEITIKQLLQHNAGVYDVSNDAVPGYGDQSYVEYMLQHYPNYQFTSTDLVKQVTINELSYGPPDAVYHYSNTGYTMLGEIIARVYSIHAGQPKTYDDYLHDKLYGPDAKVPLQISFVDDAQMQQLPSPYVKGMIVYPDKTTISDLINASPHVAEGNGIGTMEQLNRYIRTLMKAENVLTKNSITMMQTDEGIANTPETHYALGCANHPVLGYGHNGATEGYLSTMMYDPKTDVSVVVLIPYWDLRDGMNSFSKCLETLVKAGLAARQAIGYSNG